MSANRERESGGGVRVERECKQRRSASKEEVQVEKERGEKECE